MKALWFTNIPLEPQQAAIGIHLKGSGFWMSSLANALEQVGEIELVSACIAPRLPDMSVKVGRVLYRSMPESANEATNLSAMQRIIAEEKPDIIHIHGTERFYGVVETVVPVLISLQGLVSEFAAPKQFYGTVGFGDLLRTIRFQDILRRRALFIQRKSMVNAGVREIEIIRKNRNFAGRTTWDRAIQWRHNPAARYFHAEEVMRAEFFGESWREDACDARTLLVGNVGAPRRGTETMLEAFAVIASKYADARLRVMGNLEGFDGYTRDIRRRIVTHPFADRIVCTGYLSAAKLSDEMRRNGMFILTSSAENSPNSLCEAMCVGMPVVGTYVGGVPDLVRDGVNGRLFPFGDATLLAATVANLFDNREIASRLGAQACADARRRHDPVRAAAQYLGIYEEIIHDACNCPNRG